MFICLFYSRSRLPPLLPPPPPPPPPPSPAVPTRLPSARSLRSGACVTRRTLPTTGARRPARNASFLHVLIGGIENLTSVLIDH